MTSRESPVDLQPTLASATVILRPLRPDDYDALFAVAADPLIWEQHPESDRWTEPVFRRFFQGALDSGGAFAVLDAHDGRIIGSTRFFGYDATRSEIEIGWTFLARAYWGGRHNGEMKRLLLDHAFGFVRTVVFLIGPENIRSQKSVERIGATRAGTRRQGDGRTSVVYAIRASEWIEAGQMRTEGGARGET